MLYTKNKYDHLNRLLEANYSKPGSSQLDNYLEKLEYDKNGNITKLERNSGMDALAGFTNLIDKLDFSYDANKKKLLKKVVDISTSPQGFKDGANPNDDFSYDDNGNLTQDLNKNITKITYNHLNLPVKITFGATGTIDYIYNAIGQKICKKVNENTVTTTTDYLSGFQYKNNVLAFFSTAEGYVNFTSSNTNGGGNYGYVFNYTDHLGNVRLSYSDIDKNGILGNEYVQECATTIIKKGIPITNCISYFKSAILEENNYYPFGLKHADYNTANSQPSYNYKYNGKELQEELGLNMYDYGARNYDPALGRWMNIDPLAETSRRWNPYNYCYNNPLVFIDPDGMKAEKIIVQINETDSEGEKVETNLEYKNGKLYGSNGKEYKGSDSYAKEVLKDLNEIKNSGDSEMVNRLDKLEKSENEHVIKDVENDAEGNSNTGDSAIFQKLGISTGSTTEYDPTRTKNIGGDVRDPVIALVHEMLGHGYDNEMGTWTSDSTTNGIRMNEVRAVNIENKMRAVKGATKRTTYGKSKGRWNKIPAELLE